MAKVLCFCCGDPLGQEDFGQGWCGSCGTLLREVKSPKSWKKRQHKLKRRLAKQKLREEK